MSEYETVVKGPLKLKSDSGVKKYVHAKPTFLKFHLFTISKPMKRRVYLKIIVYSSVPILIFFFFIFLLHSCL